MLIAILLGVFTYCAVPAIGPIFASLKKANYQGKKLPTALGLAFVLPTSLVALGAHDFLLAVTLLFFSCLGLLDDCVGNPKNKGFRGHFWGKGPTTGALKAVAGGLFSLVLGSFQAASSGELILNGLLVALAANTLNLLDLRPGRGAKFFLISLALLALYCPCGPAFFWLAAALVGYLPWDLQEVVMMGDAGANPLGAALGLAMVLALPFWGKVVFALLLLSLNLLAERTSLSGIIEANGVLRFLDQIGRLR